jgi:hypothetical protein
MSDLLFDVPWWIPTFLALLGAVVFWNGNNQLNARLKKIGMGLIVFAAAWFALSYFVDTDKEKAQKWTKQLVSSVAAGDWQTFRSHLAPDVRFSVQDGNSFAEGSERVSEYAKAGAQSINLQSANVQTSRAEQTGPYITVFASISSSQNLKDFPQTASSSFQFDWQLSKAGWVIHEIRIVQIFNYKARDLQDAMKFVKAN